MSVTRETHKDMLGRELFEVLRLTLQGSGFVLQHACKAVVEENHKELYVHVMHASYKPCGCSMYMRKFASRESHVISSCLLRFFGQCNNAVSSCALMGQCLSGALILQDIFTSSTC
eukprot:1156532-Pelagomonas_calceolata.AAC.11